MKRSVTCDHHKKKYCEPNNNSYLCVLSLEEKDDIICENDGDGAYVDL